MSKYSDRMKMIEEKAIESINELEKSIENELLKPFCLKYDFSFIAGYGVYGFHDNKRPKKYINISAMANVNEFKPDQWRDFQNLIAALEITLPFTNQRIGENLNSFHTSGGIDLKQIKR